MPRQIVAILDTQCIVCIEAFELTPDKRLTEHIAAIHPSESIGVICLFLTFPARHDDLPKILQQRRALINFLIICCEQTALATAAERFRCLRAISRCIPK